MPPVVTVPCSNSSEDYFVTVSAGPSLASYSKLRAQQSSEDDTPMQKFKIFVSVRYFSSDTTIHHGHFDGLFICSKFKIPVSMLISDEAIRSSLSLEIISLMIEFMNIPFTLDKLQWEEKPKNKDNSYGCSYGGKTPLMDHDDMIKHILDYARCMDGAREIAVSIDKRVTLPHDEFEACMSWAGDEKRINSAGFDEEYKKLIVDQPLIELEAQLSDITDLAGEMFKPAATSSVKALEEMIVEGGGDDHGVCSICIEEFVVGSVVTRMPCAHMYHQRCILNWLQKNHRCPYCRFKLMSRIDILLLLNIQVGFGSLK